MQEGKLIAREHTALQRTENISTYLQIKYLAIPAGGGIAALRIQHHPHFRKDAICEYDRGDHRQTQEE